MTATPLKTSLNRTLKIVFKHSHPEQYYFLLFDL